MLCEKCQQNEATCHIITIEGDVSESKDLCSECYEASSPEAGELASAQREAQCEYCGGQPCAGGIDFLAMATGVQKFTFMCMPCTMEHNRYIRERLLPEASALSQHEQLAMLRTLNEEADNYMKKWVSERGPQ
jgi:protein-arginine kinase activator protein McsA